VRERAAPGKGAAAGASTFGLHSAKSRVQARAIWFWRTEMTAMIDREPGRSRARRGSACGIGIAALLAAGIAGCVPASPPPSQPATVVRIAPPPPRYEAPPPAPSARVEWVPGRWRWDGHDYRWQEGRYVERPAGELRWVPGRWVASSAGWMWQEGHWER
jgi:hypothetical protein